MATKIISFFWLANVKKIFHRCLLPSLVPFGQVVSEEKIKTWKS
jgi:hypothetical protein